MSFTLAKFYARSRFGKVLNRILLVLLVLLILAAPLPFGSVEAFPILIMELLIALCFLIWIIKLIFSGDTRFFREYHSAEKARFARAPFFHRWALLGSILRFLTFRQWPRKYEVSNVIENARTQELPKISYYSFLGLPVKNTGIEKIALFFLVLIAVQLIPLPDSVVRIISPVTSLLYETAGSTIGTSVSLHPISLDSYLTFNKFLEYCSYFLLYIVIVNSSPSRTFYRTILVTFIFSAGFQALYGLVEFMSGHHHIFWYKKLINTEYVTGTFINKNHFAAYLELCLPLLLALLVGHMESIPKFKGSIRFVISRILEGEMGRMLFLIFLLGTMYLALLFSLSRGGVLFGTLSCLLFFILYLSHKRKTTQAILPILIVLTIFSVGLLYSAGPLLARFKTISREFMEERSRLQVYKDTFSIFMDFPATGTGLATFQKVFPAYKSFSIEGFYRYAHNDYVQLIAETGVFGAIILLCFLFTGWDRISDLLKRKFDAVSLLHSGLFCALFACALHSLIEFPLQIPAVAVTFTILAAMFFRTPSGESKIL